MDTESLKSLGWLIVWGGFFYFMMRHGCGAHMMGGHGGHDHSQGRDALTGDGVKDPVCGMIVNPKKASAAAVHRGSTHYFCSTDCRDKFEASPEKYVGATVPANGAHGGNHHA